MLRSCVRTDPFPLMLNPVAWLMMAIDECFIAVGMAYNASSTH